MRRRINSTGRKVIPLEKIRIRLVDDGTPAVPPAFTADLSALAELKLAPDARVYVEAHVSTSSMRFAFGPVAMPVAPADTRLSELDTGGSILFRVMVVDESGDVGRLLAVANEIRPKDRDDDHEGQKSILPVKSCDLGEEIWRIDIDGAARPLLLVNNRVPFLAEQLKSSALLQGAILPHAIRRVLEIAFVGNSTDDSTGWVQDWRTFAGNLLGEDIPDELEEDQLDELLRRIVEAYTLKLRFATHAATPAALTGVIND